MTEQEHINTFFESAFCALTDNCPLKWQRRLFDQFTTHDAPSSIDLPTGLGKTSVIPIWLIALAAQAGDGNVRLPRRLVYIVNRRTVVDQATDVVAYLRERLLAPNDERWSAHADVLCRLSDLLRGLAADEEGPPLAVSTLRGELADNKEWKTDPARPAIIVGTIDMVGSKLLFSGYGDGRYKRAQHAGLIGQDTLIVHDEAHLTPAFSKLLRFVAAAQRGSATNEAVCPRPIHVLELTATVRDGDDAGSSFGLEKADEADPVVQMRLGATKHLHWHELTSDDEKTTIEKLVQMAAEHEGKAVRVLIYVRSPEQAGKVASALRKRLGRVGKDRVALLTGTIRGHERNNMVSENEVMRELLRTNAKPLSHTVYLVSTSAGEVGIDLDADHMVCDLTTLDSLIQRFGRVNRRGENGRVARVDVVVRPPKHKKGNQGKNGGEISPLDQAVAETRTVLKDAASQPLDVSPGALRRLLGELDEKRRTAVFAPKPDTPQLSDIVLDAWSLTSVDGALPGRPAVSAHLHGLTNDPPETFVAWREEIKPLCEAEAEAATLTEWFHACPIQSQERLRDRTYRVHKLLKSLFEQLRKQHGAGHGRDDLSVVLLDERGNAAWSQLSELAGEDGKRLLPYCIVVLPVDAGGLSADGMLAPKAIPQPAGAETDAAGESSGARNDLVNPDLDVAHQGVEQPAPLRFLVDGDTWCCLETGEEILLEPDQEKPSEYQGWSERQRITLREGEQSEESVEKSLVLLVPPRQAASTDAELISTGMELLLAGHGDDTATIAERIANRLGLNDDLKQILATAARHHDDGKAHPLWQYMAYNNDYSDEGEESKGAWAKSPRYRPGRVLAGYRHEFGSLLRLAESPQLSDPAQRDLVLHLIAAHHGRARPHFESQAADNTRSRHENEQMIVETPRRFARLQRRYGRWGLAWLESLLRCADALASRRAAGWGDSLSSPNVSPREETA